MSLETACKKRFPVGRQFYNFYQAKQFVDKFSLPWGMLVTQESDKIFCCFGRPNTKKTNQLFLQGKEERLTRVTRISLVHGN